MYRERERERERESAMVITAQNNPVVFKDGSLSPNSIMGRSENRAIMPCPLIACLNPNNPNVTIYIARTEGELGNK